jgi:hypothetical protein
VIHVKPLFPLHFSRILASILTTSGTSCCCPRHGSAQVVTEQVLTPCMCVIVQKAAAAFNTTNGKFNRFSQTAMVTPAISGIRNKDALTVRRRFCCPLFAYGCGASLRLKDLLPKLRADVPASNSCTLHVIRGLNGVADTCRRDALCVGLLPVSRAPSIFANT